MTDEPHNPNDGEATPVFRDRSRPRFDKTIKLDMAIANGNLTLPSHFGRYQVLKRIGIGGFASVYSAFDPELESEVAIKVLAENHSANTAVRQRFVAEARVARRLGNERLIGVFDLGETDDGRPYVVMELASRGTLRQRIVRTGRPSRQDLIRLIDELGACLSAIHAKDVVHRDIKPSNLLFRTKNLDDFVPTRLIEDDERLVLADFGLARDISGGASALTVGGGTEGYMAPEQATTDGKPDVRADIYSATVVVAEMTTGRHPERLDLATADISTGMLEALTRSMSVDREQRPADAEEWRQLLAGAYASDANASYPTVIGHDAETAHLDATGEPPLAPTDIQTDIPHTGIEAISYTPAAGTGTPPPPPGLAPPADQRPPEVERPNALIAAARAQAEAEQREAERKAARRAERRQARGGRRAAVPGPVAPGPQSPHVPAVGDGPAAAAELGGTDPIPPAPPPAPAQQQPPVIAGPAAAAGPPVAPEVSSPPGGPSVPSMTGPGVTPPTTPPTSQPAGGPLIPTPESGPRPPGGGLPTVVPGPAPAIVPGPDGPQPVPAGPRADPAEVSRRRSREHMRTASRLAKLERKQNRKRVRRTRRRRRRLRVINFFLAIIRGLLAGGLALIAGNLVAVALIGDQLQNRPGPQIIVLLVSGIAFVWGLSYFPFPRSYDV